MCQKVEHDKLNGDEQIKCQRPIANEIQKNKKYRMRRTRSKNR